MNKKETLIYSFCWQETRFDKPITEFTEDQLEELDIRYYNAAVHKAAFILPQFAKKVSRCCRQGL